MSELGIDLLNASKFIWAHLLKASTTPQLTSISKAVPFSIFIVFTPFYEDYYIYTLNFKVKPYINAIV
jgi:hypothetical protein